MSRTESLDLTFFHFFFFHFTRLTCTMILLTMSNCDFQNLTKNWGFVGDGKKPTMNRIYVCEDIKINEKHIFSDIKCSLQCPK